MKALSVRQPWAGLIESGEKTIEVRTWKTSHRGPLMICAGAFVYKKMSREVDAAFHVMKRNGTVARRGCAVCIVDLVDVRPIKRSDESDAHYSGFKAGKDYAWVLENVRKVQEIPVRGRLSVFTLDRNSCPSCLAGIESHKTSECVDCELFYCNRCDLWVPWSFGCDDELFALCDDCYCSVEKLGPTTETDKQNG